MSDSARKLGSLIYSNILPERDAVHIAIMPGRSQVSLKRGDFVKYNAQTEMFELVSHAAIADGIVDPYLYGYDTTNPKYAFYVCLFPGSIMSLRHDWVHKNIPAAKHSEESEKIAFAKSWIEGFADQVDMSAEELFNHAREYLLDRWYYVCEGGKYEGVSVPDAFWDHFETVTGEAVPVEKRGSFFSCSC